MEFPDTTVSFLALNGLASIVYFIIVGVVAGALARLILPGKQPMNIFLTMLLGIGGAFLGGFVAYKTNVRFDKHLWVGFAYATVGAFVLLAIVELIRRLSSSSN